MGLIMLYWGELCRNSDKDYGNVSIAMEATGIK